MTRRTRALLVAIALSVVLLATAGVSILWPSRPRLFAGQSVVSTGDSFRNGPLVVGVSRIETTSSTVDGERITVLAARVQYRNVGFLPARYSVTDWYTTYANGDMDADQDGLRPSFPWFEGWLRPGGETVRDVMFDTRGGSQPSEAYPDSAPVAGLLYRPCWLGGGVAEWEIGRN